MTATATETIRYSALLHKRHGWIEAGDDAWFEQSDNLKSFWLCLDRAPAFGDHFPFGTRFNATSILAYEEQ